MNEPEPPPTETTDAAKPSKPASFAQVAGAVFWSFFGIRKAQHMRRDELTIKPLHVIAVAVLFAAVFVLVLVALARFIAHSAG